MDWIGLGAIVVRSSRCDSSKKIRANTLRGAAAMTRTEEFLTKVKVKMGVTCL